MSLVEDCREAIRRSSQQRASQYWQVPIFRNTYHCNGPGFLTVMEIPVNAPSLLLDFANTLYEQLCGYCAAVTTG
jgi:hypothetical protein